MERPSRVAVEPGPHLGMLVRRIVVEDGVYGLSRRDLAFDFVEEPNEFLMPMALHVFANDRAVQDVQGREQRRRAVSLVVMCHGSCAPLLQRQPRLGSIKCLNLRLFIH